MAPKKTQLAKVKIKLSNNEPKPDADEFRKNVTNMYLRNKLSAKDTATLVASAHASGAGQLADIRNVGKGEEKNIQRNLMRKLTKTTKWPEPYYADIPIRDRKTGKKSIVTLPFLLISEVLFHLVASAGMSFRDLLDFPPGSGFARMKSQWSNSFDVHDSMVSPIGVHGDGVPLQKKMTLEMMSWNICSIKSSERHLFTCIEKQDLCDCGCAGRCTLDAILEILLWDILSLTSSKWPTCRHDKSNWKKTDKKRSIRKGNIGFFACVLQLRGDWAFYKWLFGFKGWASTNVCWRCAANRTDVPFYDPSPFAAWRTKRYNNKDFMDWVYF